MTPPQSETPSGEILESVGTAHFNAAARALRWAFFSMGVPVGMLVPRLAEIKAGLDAGNATYGMAIASGGLGAFFGSWLGGRLTHAYGSKAVMRVGIAFIMIANVSHALAPNIVLFALVALTSGLVYSTTNIGANSQAVLVEQGLGRSYIPRAHAFWSLGTMCASLISSLIAPFVAPAPALFVGDALALVLFAVISGGLLTTEHEDRPHDDPSQLPRHERIPRGAMVFLLTLTVAQALGFLAEVSAGDWSSVLLKQEFHIAVGPNGYAFTAFLVMQLLSRLYATQLIDRFGAQRTIQWLGTGGTVGYLVCLFGASTFSNSSGVHTLVLACVAYAFLGVAVGPMPSVFTSAAGAIPGLPSARALTFTGLLMAPMGMVGRVTIANIAQWIPLPITLAGMGILVLISVSMTFVLVPDRAEKHAIKREATP